MTDKSDRILVVEDEPGMRRAVLRILESKGFTALGVEDVAEARTVLDREDVSLVLTDMTMPGQSGLDLIEFICDAHPDVATVMVTGRDSHELAEKAIEHGAFGYVIKPFQPNEILINVLNALRRRRLEIESREHRDELESRVEARTRELWKAIQDLEGTQQELRSSRQETIERLSTAAEYRSDETASHIRRVSRYCFLIAVGLGLDKETSDLIGLASLMHDIGKIGIPDSILLKPGALTAAEFETMKRHTLIGYRILGGSDSSVLRMAAKIAVTHHERFDGTGYPRGIKGTEIPIEGRLVAVADVFDALTSDRPYRSAISIPETIELMRKEREAHFDAQLFDLLIEALPDIIRIREEEEPVRTLDVMEDDTLLEAITKDELSATNLTVPPHFKTGRVSSP